MHNTSIITARFRKALFAGLTSLFLSCTLYAEDHSDSPGHTPVNNAALYYWKAIASQKIPLTPQDTVSRMFVLEDLPYLPSSALSVRKDAAIWLIDEAAIVNALRQASSQPHCTFPLKIEGRPHLDVTHIAPLRKLTKYCLQLTKAYEYADNELGAADIYTLLLDLVFNLKQDNNRTSTQAAWAMLQDIMEGLEGYASRTPKLEASEYLIQYFDQHPSLPFSLAENLRSEAERFSSWILEDPNQYISRLDRLYGNSNNKPGVLKLATLSIDDQKNKMAEWIDGYREHMETLATWTETSYLISLGHLEKMDEDLETEINKDAGDVDNPIIPLLVPYTRSLFERALLAEGQYAMIQTLIQACRYESLLGKWPKKLSSLEAFTNRKFPLDPFSGNVLYYRLRSKFPHIALRAPKWITKEDLLNHRLQLAIRKTADDKSFQHQQSLAVKQFIDQRKNEPTKRPRHK